MRVDLLDRAAVLDRARDLMQGARPAFIVTANALLVDETARNTALADACRDADLVTADGAGLVWAARRLGQPPLPRVPGIDLAFSLCGEAERLGLSVFLLGAAPGVAEEAAKALCRAYPRLSVAGSRHGYFGSDEDDAVLADIQIRRPRLLLVALGSPRQEIWVHRYRDRLPAGLSLGVGGSFDVWAGRLKRAPRFLQDRSLEWSYRLIQEPSRFRRMLRLPAFAWRVLRAR